METYDIVVIGGGPAGAMAAIRAGQLKKRVFLIERNEDIGRKILLTGKGRCNITNTALIDEFMDRFGKDGEFLRTALSTFSNEDLMDFFKSEGLELKVERQGRVFPASDNAVSVVQTLKECLKKYSVEVACSSRVRQIVKDNRFFRLHIGSANEFSAKRVIIATGGASYKATGSSGDGFLIAQELGHSITPLKGGLVPLRTKELWVKDVQGLALKNIRLIFVGGKKKIMSDVGEMIFTHFGVSGPLVLDLSAKIAAILENEKEVSLFIDLKPGLNPEQIEKKLLSEIRAQGVKELKGFLKTFLPVNLIPIFMNLMGLNSTKKVHQITQKERSAMQKMLKAMPLTVIGTLPIEEAMVTCGGVSLKEINPRTMESKIVPGLYFAGEILDGCASSGGYNLQQAFSTGYLAGENAANA